MTYKDVAHILNQSTAVIESNVPAFSGEVSQEPGDVISENPGLNEIIYILTPESEPLDNEVVDVPLNMAEAFRQERLWDQYHEVTEIMGEYLSSMCIKLKV